MEKQEKEIFRKFEKGIGEVIIKGIRLYDPRVKRFRRPGNNNPALILRDMLVQNGSKLMKEDDRWIKKMANFCDKKEIGLSSVIEKANGC